MFSTDAKKLQFILEAEAGLSWLLDEDESLSAEAKAEERPKYITNYIGSKQKLVDWIWANTPDTAKSAVDAFSGSSVVGYMYKSKGLAVQSMDRLAYCHHIARAIVENDSVTLSDEEIENLLSDHGNAKDFVRKNFGGIYFNAGVHKLIDVVRSNADKLSGFKKDIALFALGKTCITAKGGFGHFGTTKKHDDRADDPGEFKERFAKNCQRINALVFKGEQPCKAHHGDTRKLLGAVKAKVAYFDPPYATFFSQTNYERAYHFIEGLMTWWEGKEIQKDSKTKQYDIPTEVTKANSKDFFEAFLGAAKHIDHWIISYRDKAYPSEAEIKKIVANNGKSSRMKTKTHQYQISAGHGENSLAKEHLFVCGPGSTKASATLERNHTLPMAPGVHTRIVGTVDETSLQAEADKAGDKRFRFILTHVGTNRNGDHFAAEELQQAAETAVGKKIDLSHSQEFRDIVGGIVTATFVDDGENSRVECEGELYTEDSEPARLAYKLMKRGIVTHVSMECDYQQGECSICGKKITSKGDYCTHLKNFKGREVKGKPCFEILRGVTFTGMGLLDRQGADQRAEIQNVAAIHTEHEGEQSMDEETKKDTKAADTPSDQQGPSDGEKSKLIKKQEAEIERLTRELEAVKKQLEDSHAAQRAALRKSKAEKLLELWKEAGRDFGDEASHAAEIDRLMGLSDDAFAAIEDTVSSFAATAKKRKQEEPDPKEDEEKEEEEDETPLNPKKKKKAKANLKADAGVVPVPSPDGKPRDLAGKLTEGFMAAYKDRYGFTEQQ